MKGRDVWWRRLRLVVAVGALLVVVAAMLRLDRSSIERANKLYRQGSLEVATDLYRRHADAPDRTETAVYNLGTALLALGQGQAERYLRMAAQGVDPVARQRAHYNLGVRALTSATATTDPDSATPVVASAVRNNRAALRLDPTDENAQWNLALAQMMLDSLSNLTGEPAFEDAPVPEEEVPVGADPGAEMTDQLGQEQQGAVPVAGAREALARMEDDPGPLTREQARRYLELVSDDVEEMVRGVLWSQRPVRSGWRSQPPPGGRW